MLIIFSLRPQRRFLVLVPAHRAAGGGILPPQPQPDKALTPREQEVLDLLIEGKPYKKIGDELGVSIDTVRSHVRKVYGKLHIHSRTEIMLKFGKRRR